MRLACLTALSALAAAPALAADFPMLRGTSSPSLPPPPLMEQTSPATWDGFYIGGLAGYGSAGFAPRNGASDLAARALRNTVLESTFNASQLIQPGNFSARSQMFGAFTGYNFAFGEAVLGIEADWTHFGKDGSGIDQISRQFTTRAGFQERISMRGGNATKLNDLFTIRGRAGYAMGNVMPYVTAGLALGYGRVSNFVDITTQGQNLDPANPVAIDYGPNTVQLAETRRNSFMAGFAGGAGVEAMFGGLVLRGEYLYTRLQAQGGVTIDVNQGRVGAGVKF
jgi:opacity protein-like surface antigen